MAKAAAARKPRSANTAATTVGAEYVPSHGHGRLIPWQPGQSGNPAGNTNLSEYHRVRQLCGENSLAAAREQIALMTDNDSRVRFMATEAVLNRGVGKPRDHSGDEKQNQRMNLSALSGEEIKSLGELLKKALGL